jgi:hypothetical protein
MENSMNIVQVRILFYYLFHKAAILQNNMIQYIKLL